MIWREPPGRGRAKIDAVAALTSAPLRWHMIGHVQSRKARLVTRGYALLHSLDSVRLARRLDAYLSAQARALDVLLQVNGPAKQPKRLGCVPVGYASTLRAALWREVEAVRRCPAARAGVDDDGAAGGRT